jgi:hypothetical protein
MIVRLLHLQFYQGVSMCCLGMGVVLDSDPLFVGLLRVAFLLLGWFA